MNDSIFLKLTFSHSFSSCRQCRRQLCGTGARAPPRLPTVSFLFHFRINLTANYCVVCDSTAGADVNNSQIFRSVQH